MPHQHVAQHAQGDLHKAHHGDTGRLSIGEGDGQQQLADGRRESHARHQREGRGGEERLRIGDRPVVEQQPRRQGEEQRHARKVRDHRPRVEVLQPVQANHREPAHQRTRECREGGLRGSRGVGLLDQPDPGDTGRGGDPDIGRRKLPEQGPRENRHPDGVEVGHGENLRDGEARKGIEGSHHAEAPRDAAQPEIGGTAPDQPGPGPHRQRGGENERDRRAGDHRQLPGTPLPQGMRAGPHHGEGASSGQHRQVRKQGPLREARGGNRVGWGDRRGGRWRGGRQRHGLDWWGGAGVRGRAQGREGTPGKAGASERGGGSIAGGGPRPGAARVFSTARFRVAVALVPRLEAGGQPPGRPVCWFPQQSCFLGTPQGVRGLGWLFLRRFCSLFTIRGPNRSVHVSPGLPVSVTILWRTGWGAAPPGPAVQRLGPPTRSHPAVF